MKLFFSVMLIFAFTILTGCGSSSLLTQVSGTAVGADAQSAYKTVSSVFAANNFSVSGDDAGFKGLIADYGTPWKYSIYGDGENFHEKIFTLGMEITVDITANAAGGTSITLKPIYWQTEELGALDKKLDKIADKVNSATGKDVLGKTEGASAFPNASSLRYYKEDDRESGALTPEDTKIYKKMIVVFSKVVDEISAQLNIGKDKLKLDIKE